MPKLTLQQFTAETTLVSYHSQFCSDISVETACGIAILPIKSEFPGPAPKPPSPDMEDIIDEALTFFRAQVLFKNFEVKGPADKTLIYLTCFIQKCLELISKNTDKDAATKALQKITLEEVSPPSKPGFFMKGLCTADIKNEGKCSKYMKQLKQECAKRLMDILYNPQWGTLDLKFWLGFSKKKFLKLEFN